MELSLYTLTYSLTDTKSMLSLLHCARLFLGTFKYLLGMFQCIEIERIYSVATGARESRQAWKKAQAHSNRQDKNWPKYILCI